ncbi:uncharacterized protein LOC101856372 [Aplysia californica]|uniref:Uncharacterized protein LOC101856372 n=1 Tax=Aplysia californica TaxID=6500 RepID=A0ABM0K2A5_APLCA|nr:uncharacterized protein LOC101856372 [Aplysia californica]
MASDARPPRSKNLPTILSKLKAMSSSSESRELNSRAGHVSRNNSTEDGGGRGRPEPRGTPRLAWASRRDSSMSTISSLGNGPGEHTTPGKPLLARIPSIMSLGGSTSPWGKRLKKKRDAEEYAAQKLARQKAEMIAFYKGTPMTDDRATSTEILRFLYDLWEPQLCPSYRRDANISTSCRQDLRSARRIAQAMPRRAAKLHRARLVIDTCTRMSVSGGAPDSARGSVPSRPQSAKSVI